MKVRGPWKPGEAENLVAWQNCDWVHPFTCPNRGDGKHKAFAQTASASGMAAALERGGDVGVLAVHIDGFLCPFCAIRRTGATISC